jgi:hypothetical protein
MMASTVPDLSKVRDAYGSRVAIDLCPLMGSRILETFFNCDGHDC